MEERKDYIQEIKDAIEARSLARQRVQSSKPGQTGDEDDGPLEPRALDHVDQNPRSKGKEGPHDKSQTGGTTNSPDRDGPHGKAKSADLSKLAHRDLSSPVIKSQSAGASPVKVVAVESKAQLDERGLRYINLSTQGIPAVPRSIFSHKDVGTLDLSGNNLREVPKEICGLKSLFKLDLSRNGIRCMHSQDFKGLPAEMAQLRSLEILNLSECNLAFIPPVVWQIESLQHLNISRNKINLLVPEVGNLTRLRILDAQQTNLSSVPSEIAYCQELEEILLWGNTIERLPETLKDLPVLKKLAINYRNFAAIVDQMDGMEEMLKNGERTSGYIPAVLFELTCLSVLDLEETKINWLPDTCLAKLTEFYLARNYFTKVPQMVFTIDSLQVLDLSRNQIGKLPEQIGILASLVTLRANSNHLDAVPDQICDLANLEELSLGGNRLKQLPADIGRLTKLRTCILDHNYISSLPESLTNLTLLETLDLTGNAIESLPLEFHRMALKTAHGYRNYHKYGLWLHGNPLRVPPESVWQKEDPQNIYTYLRKLQIRNTQDLQVLKLIILGDTQSGKSSLVKTMMMEKSFLTTQQDATQIVEYTLWMTDNLVKFNVIEFGGHESYKSLHQMFMDPKALYLIVYDHSTLSDDNFHTYIGQWLDLIILYAPKAVVKLVGTKCDLAEQNLEETRELAMRRVTQHLDDHRDHLQEEIRRGQATIMKQRSEGDSENRATSNLLLKLIRKLEAMLHDNLRLEQEVTLVTSCSGIRGIPDLVNELEMLAINGNLFPHARRFVPDYWFHFRSDLKAAKVDFLTWKQVAAIGRKHEMRNELLQACVEFLVDSGDILWFPHKDSVKDLVFHRPRDLVCVLRCLFSHDIHGFLDFERNKVLVHKGGFTRDSLEQARDAFLTWGQASRGLLLCLWFHLQLDTQRFDVLMDLMPKLDLCYLVPEPELPPARGHFVPLMVSPAYNVDTCPDVSEIWPEMIPMEVKEVDVRFNFPFGTPRGLFEQFCCRVQGLAETRVDWRDLVYFEVGSTRIAVRESETLDRENGSSNMKGSEYRLMIRGTDSDMLQNCTSFLCQNLYNLFLDCPGLVWHLDYSTVHEPHIVLEEWFPSGLFVLDDLQDYKDYKAGLKKD